jgi:hypothetical protein
MGQRLFQSDSRFTLDGKPAGQTQALCFARTDDKGYIRWFSGFGWEGQGEITTSEKWTASLKGFAAKFIKTPYVKDPSFEVHTLAVPAETPPPAPKPE